MQIPVGKRRSKQVVVVDLAVSVMIAVNPPDFRPVQDRLQLLVERSLGLQVSQEHHGGRPVLTHGFDDVIEVAMDVAAEEKPPHKRSPFNGRKIIRPLAGICAQMREDFVMRILAHETAH